MADAQQDQVYDVIVIGGGPAGASAAIYASRANLRTLVFDKSMTVGALGITAKIANYPGVPEVISGLELLQRMWDQAKLYGTEFVKKRVAGSILGDTPKQVFTADGQAYQAKTIIVATGAMGRASVVPGEEELLGHGVSYCATCDAAFFKDQLVAVVGHNEEAVEEGLFLTKFARTVYFVSPKEKLSVEAGLAHHLEGNEKVQMLKAKTLRRVVGNGKVSSVVLRDRKGQEEEITVDGVFIYTQGSKPIVDYLGGQVEMTPEGFLLVNQEMQTSLPGVFACGDLLGGAVKQAVVAAAYGCIAALAADKFINKRAFMAKDYK